MWKVKKEGIKKEEVKKEEVKKWGIKQSGREVEKQKPKKSKQEKAENFGSIWNPLNLQKEVRAFGYNFHWKTYAIMTFCILLLAIAIGLFFHLRVVYVSIIFFAVLIFLPLMITDTYKRMYEQKRFADVTDYMEQVLYSFRKERKVLAALRDCKNAIPDGMMKRSIDEAIAYMEAGQIQTEKGAIMEALSSIEKYYDCDRLHMVHEFLAGAEERGGEIEQSIELLVEDIEVWKRQTYELQKNKKTHQTECILSIVVAALVCGADMYIMEKVKSMAYAGGDITIFQQFPVQISSLVFVLICLFAFYKSSKRMTADWLNKQKDEAAALKAYEYVMNFDEPKALRGSLCMAGIFFAGAAICYLWFLKIVSLLLLLVGIFMAFQHRFSYQMNLRDVKQSLYRAFPEWMFDMALLLQNNNVQVAITKSLPKAQLILKGELEELLVRIKENPSDARSYTLFCEKFDVPEIATCMKMLYSVSESGAGDAQKQIENLIRHVHKLQEKEAALENENITFKMRAISFYPVGGTSVKMFVDMTIGTLLILSLFQGAF